MDCYRRRRSLFESQTSPPTSRKPALLPPHVHAIHRQINTKLEQMHATVIALGDQNQQLAPMMEHEISGHLEVRKKNALHASERQRALAQSQQSEYDVICEEIAHVRDQLSRAVEEERANNLKLTEVATSNRQLRSELAALRQERLALKSETQREVQIKLQKAAQEHTYVPYKPLYQQEMENKTTLENTMMVQGLHNLALQKLQSVSMGMHSGKPLHWSSRLHVLNEVQSPRLFAPATLRVRTCDIGTDTELDAGNTFVCGVRVGV
ncbi:hypothetical protein AB1Y20_011686 [Prymnesium parvum]|uniref:Cilia- and flagella-associated protein 157 n=1 Tax=Prymnesium parvum TaxID=97485 RepID=A0AB34IKP2_PRYPA